MIFKSIFNVLFFIYKLYFGKKKPQYFELKVWYYQTDTQEKRDSFIPLDIELTVIARETIL